MSFACAPNPARVVLDVRFSATTQEASVVFASLPGYIAGMTDVNVLVDAGVTLWSDDSTKAGLAITGTGNAYDRVRLVNKGTIMGRGGNGASLTEFSGSFVNMPPVAGSPALRLTNVAVEIDNALGTLAGGGGGGGAGWNSAGNLDNGAGGGGGAGGGFGGSVVRSSSPTLSTPGGTPGALGQPGQSGTGGVTTGGAGGGGGGRIIPGTSVTAPIAISTQNTPGAPGGSAGGAGAPGVGGPPFGTHHWCAAGGGGGWGQAGGTGMYYTDSATPQSQGGAGNATTAGGNGSINGAQVAYQFGAAGGKAIELVSGASRTIVAAGTMYGATS